MEYSHLIVGNREDYHAVAVAWALKQLGEPAVVWDGISSSPDGQICLRPDNEDGGVSLGGSSYSRFKSLWFRRPIRYPNLDNIADHVKDFVKCELRYSYWNLAAALERRSMFTVGTGYMAAFACKEHQLKCALDAGFKIPKTVITNNFDEATDFISSVGKAALKPFNPFYWRDDDSNSLRVAATAIVSSPNELTKDSVEACPSIYQEYIEKAYELRVTVIGNRVFAAKISRVGGGSFVDWRMKIDSDEAIVEAMQLDPVLEATILEYVRGLGLAYGCLDLVVDDAGTAYFLEINPGGQFLFVEDLVPELPLLNAFSSMLSAGALDYDLKRNDDISVSRFDRSVDWAEMQEARGKLVTEPPFYTRVVGAGQEDTSEVGA